MTKEQAIKKYNLIKYDNSDDFLGTLDYEMWRNRLEDSETIKIYTLTNEYALLTEHNKNKFYLIVQIKYKNKLKRWKNTDSFMCKTLCRTYEIKGE